MNKECRDEQTRPADGTKTSTKTAEQIREEVNVAHAQLLHHIKNQGASCITESTQTQPGSPEKIAVLAERLSRGLDLFLPEDKVVFAEKYWINEK